MSSANSETTKVLSVNGIWTTQEVSGAHSHATLSGISNKVTLRGTCDQLMASGVCNVTQVDGASTSSFLSGTYNLLVVKGNCTKVRATGLNNNLIIGGDCPEFVETGTSNRTAVSGSCIKFVVNGAKNVTEVKGVCTECTCNVDGAKNTVLVNGNCPLMTINGLKNNITVGSCKTLTLTGASQKITINGDCETLLLTGPKHNVTIKGNVTKLKIDGSSDLKRTNTISTGEGSPVKVMNITNDFSIVHGTGSINRSDFIGIAHGDLGNEYTTVGTGSNNNVVNVEGDIGDIEIIQKQKDEEGSNNISIGGSCTGIISIAGTKNEVTALGTINKVLVDGGGGRNIIRCKSYNDTDPGEDLVIQSEDNNNVDQRNLIYLTQ